jgi:Mrp family chromosome partitioning ATPase
VLLVDADLRRSRVAAALGLGDRALPGLADFVSRAGKSLADVTVKPGAFGFALLPAGRAAESVHRIVRSARLDQMIAEAREQYDFVLLDTPPLVPVFDAAVLSRSVDGVIVVVAAGRTPRRLLEAALEQIDARKVIGIVFNGDPGPLFGYSRSYYHSYFPAHARTP